MKPDEKPIPYCKLQRIRDMKIEMKKPDERSNSDEIR
jgi:hypothetical protein